MRLEAEQQGGDDEPHTPDDLGSPICAVESGGGERGLDGRESGEAGDPEDGRAEELREAGEKADVVQEVDAQVVGGGEPDPRIEHAGVAEASAGVRVLLCRRRRRRAPADQIAAVEVVVRAGLAIGGDAHEPVLLEDLLERPAEAVRAILIHSLDHEEDASDFEDGGADEGGDARGGGFGGEGGGGEHGGQPGEEGVEDPDYGAPGEGLCGQVGDVPEGVVDQHLIEVVQDGVRRVGGGRGEVEGGGGGGGGDEDGVAAWEG